jgi:hypothetical protein
MKTKTNKEIIIEVRKNKDIRKFLIQFIQHGHGKVLERLSNKKIKCEGCEFDMDAIIEYVAEKTLTLKEADEIRFLEDVKKTKLAVNGNEMQFQILQKLNDIIISKIDKRLQELKNEEK